MPSGLAPGVSPVVNSEMAWVVGLIEPIALFPVSANQSSPLGPAVIANGSEFEEDSENSLTVESKQRDSSSSRQSLRFLEPALVLGRLRSGITRVSERH